MTGSDLIVLAPWIVFGAAVGVICARLLAARSRARSRTPRGAERLPPAAGESGTGPGADDPGPGAQARVPNPGRPGAAPSSDPAGITIAVHRPLRVAR